MGNAREIMSAWGWEQQMKQREGEGYVLIGTQGKTMVFFSPWYHMAGGLTKALSEFAAESKITGRKLQAIADMMERFGQ